MIIAVLLLFFACTAADAQTGHRVKVNGMTSYYEVSGSGAPRVILHGTYMNIRDIGEVIPKLARPRSDRAKAPACSSTDLHMTS